LSELLERRFYSTEMLNSFGILRLLRRSRKACVSNGGNDSQNGHDDQEFNKGKTSTLGVDIAHNGENGTPVL
jgi:hypothetical protein